jgi:hypothetical protein
MNFARVGVLTLLLAPALLNAESAMYLVPESGTFSRGEIFQVQVVVDADESVNAVEGELLFDPSAFRATAISSAGSILTTWPQVPSYSNGDGTVTFSGWGKPFQGNDGSVITVTFETLRPSTSGIQLSSGAALAVGQGSNIITALRSASYRLEID